MAKQRQVRIEQGLPQNLMEEMQERTDEQLESESKHRSIALALLGARAAERYDAAAARTYFRRAIAASRPQERIQIRRMADASLALAERRPDDLKQAVERLGQAPPSGRALMGLRLMGLVAPPPGASILLRIRGFAIIAAIVITALALGLGVVELIAWPVSGGIGLAPGILLGLIVVGIALAVLAFFGRRRQAAARAGGKTASPTGKGAAAAKASGTTAKGAAGGKTGKGATGGGAATGKGATSRRTATGKSSTAATAATNGQARRGGQARGAAKPAAPTKTAAAGKPDAPAKPASGKSGPPAKGPQGQARRKRPSR
jgi:hypothetical protein